MGRHSVETVLRHVDWNLRHCRAEGIVRTLMFIRDASMYSHPAQDEFCCEMDQSTVWEVFGELLYHRNGNVRSNTIYTIGRLGCWRRAGLLHRAFPYYLRTDPINLCGLMREMRTFNKSGYWARLKQIVEAPHYLHRWSLCSATYEVIGDEAKNLRRFLELYERLSKDLHPLVAANARHRCEVFRHAINGALCNDREDPGRRLSPSLDFDTLDICFQNAKRPHTLSQLDRFAKSLVETERDKG